MYQIMQFILQLAGRKKISVRNAQRKAEAIRQPETLDPLMWPQTTIPVGRIREVTGPLELLRGRRVLAILDLENLSISAKELGYFLNLRRLHDALTCYAIDLDAHAIFSRESGHEGLVKALSRYGYTPHPREIVHFSRGNSPCLANSDSRILFEAGRLTANHWADTLLLGTGDGDLGDEIAQAVRLNFGSRWPVATLSLAGSTSHRLNAKFHPVIRANLAIGRDMLDPLPVAKSTREEGGHVAATLCQRSPARKASSV